MYVPQGFELVSALSKVIKKCPNINYIIYADDIQLYWKVPTCSINVPNELILCARNVRKLLIINNPFPNSSKTKLLNITLKPFIFLLLSFIICYHSK